MELPCTTGQLTSFYPDGIVGDWADGVSSPQHKGRVSDLQRMCSAVGVVHWPPSQSDNVSGHCRLWQVAWYVLHACALAHKQLYALIHSHTYTYRHTHTHTYSQTHIHWHTQIRTHTHIHTHLHSYKVPAGHYVHSVISSLSFHCTLAIQKENTIGLHSSAELPTTTSLIRDLPNQQKVCF